MKKLILLLMIFVMIPIAFAAVTDFDAYLVADWELDEASGTALADSGPNGPANRFNGTAEGAVVILGNGTEDVCISGNCRKLDGINDRLNWGAFDEFCPGCPINYNFTINFWVKPVIATGDRGFMSKTNIFPGKLDGWFSAIKSGTNQLTINGWFQDGGSDGTIQDGVQFTANSWEMVTVSFSFGINESMYRNGTRTHTSKQIGELATPPFAVNITPNHPIIFGTRQFDVDAFQFSGWVDELRFYNKSLTESEVQELFDFYTTTPPVLSITFDSQKPSDLSAFNVFDTDLNITYVTTLANYTSLFFIVNHTDNRPQFFFNGTVVNQGTMVINTTQSPTDRWSFLVDHNFILPGTHNLDPEDIEAATKLQFNLTNTNQFAKIGFINVSRDENLSFIVAAVNNRTAVNPMEVLYCNSTYTTGNPVTDSNCVQIFNIMDTTPFNFTDGLGSHVIPFSITSDGFIGDVGVSDNSFILFRGSSAPGWEINYISNKSRSDAFEITTNNGATWGEISGTAVVDIHQLDGADFFNYIGMTCDFSNTCVNDSNGFTNDLIDVVGLPPTAPDVFDPSEEAIITDVIEIAYTASIPSFNAVIRFYNISLYDENFNFLSSINVNNSLNLAYNWTGENISDNSYRVGVEACDNALRCSTGFSEVWTLDRANPNITLITPVNNEIIGNSSFIFNFICNDSNLFGYDMVLTNETGLVISNSTRNISGTVFHFNRTFINLSDSSYTASISCLDGHTAKFMPVEEVKKTATSLEIGDFTVTAMAKPDSIEYTKLADRYNFKFVYKPTQEYIFRVTSKEKIYYRDRSAYAGHMIAGKYWIDFEPYSIKEVQRRSDYAYDISIIGNAFDFSSIGIINNVTQSIDFIVDAIAPVLQINGPQNVSMFNGTNPAINFTYFLSSEPRTLNNCSLIFNDLNIFKTQFFPTNDANNTFFSPDVRSIGTGNHTFKFNCFETANNFSTTKITEFNTTTFNIELVIIPVLEISNALLITECPDTIANSVIWGILILVAIALIIMALVFGIPFIGIFGSLMLMVMSWYIAPCIAIVSYVIAGLSFVLLLFFAFMGFTIGRNTV